MVKSEILRNGTLIRHYSDRPGYGVKQTDTGIVYSEAVDPNPTSHTYEEAPVEDYEEELTTEEKLELYESAYERGVQEA